MGRKLLLLTEDQRNQVEALTINANNTNKP